MNFVIVDDWGRYWGGVNWYYCNKYHAKKYSTRKGATIAMKRIAKRFPSKVLHIEEFDKVFILSDGVYVSV